MTTNTNVIPAKLTPEVLYEKAGSNRLPERVVFDGHVFNGTAQYIDNPLKSIEEYTKSVYEMFEETERTEMYPGYTVDELAIACAAVIDRIPSFVTRTVKKNPMDKPSMRRVPVGYNMTTGEMDYKVVPDGATSLPWRGNCWIEVKATGDGTPFIRANVIRGDQTQLEGLFKFIRDWANANSIYLGQVVDTNFQFINMTRFDPTKVALTEKMQIALELYVRGPIMYADALKAKRQDPKTALLMYGPPGGGKTMGISLCEFQGIVAGAAVIHVDPATGVYGLERANTMATRLMDAGHLVIISFEDMEKLAKQDRAKVLEILDGAAAKSAKRVILGTTNFLGQIDRAMIRHGRFDDILYCGLPDRQAFEQMVKVAFDAADLGDIDYDFAFPYFEGYSYATIGNAASKVIRSAISRLKGDLTDFKVTTQDLVNAAELVRDHHNLMNEEVVAQDENLETYYRKLLQEAVMEGAYHVTGELSGQDNTDYYQIAEVVEQRTDSVIEGRLDGASLEDKTLHTN